jgi:hypothetical protein
VATCHRRNWSIALLKKKKKTFFLFLLFLSTICLFLSCRMWLLLVVVLVVVCECRPCPSSLASSHKFGVPFSSAPPCTQQFEQEEFSFAFSAVNLSKSPVLFGVLAAVPNWPNLRRDALLVVCSRATLSLDSTVSEFEFESAGEVFFEEKHIFVSQSKHTNNNQGPQPTSSRVFNENHPSRTGGFLADNLLFPSNSRSSLSASGLLFKNVGRYDELNPPKSDDGPAPGPGKCGGFELNIFHDGSDFVLQRFNAVEQRIDLEVLLTF